jgi:hypothetical protein
MRLSDRVQPVHYNLHWILDTNTNTLSGRVRIRCRGDSGPEPLALHCHPLMTIKTISINGISTAWSRSTDDDSIIILNNRSDTHQFAICIAFVAPIRHDALGFYDSVSETGISYSTQFQPVHARSAFPCFDEPGFKATFSVKITFISDQESEWTILSNMPPKSDVINPDTGTRTVRFHRTPMMCTYLVAVVIAQLQPCAVESTAHGTEVRVWDVPDGTIERHAIAKYVVAILETLADLLGVSYKLPKLDLVPIQEFEWGAMENWGLLTFQTSQLHASVEDPYGTWGCWEIIAHEVIHQWIGNLVTLAWWDDLWIHEGIASFLAAWVLSRLGVDGAGLGAAYAWPMFVQNNLQGCVDMPPDSIVVGDSKYIDHADFPGSMFTACTYCKSALIIRSVWLMLDDAGFAQWLKRVINTHAYGNVDRLDMRAHLLQLNNGEEAWCFLEAWIVTADFPVLSVYLNGDVHVHPPDFPVLLYNGQEYVLFRETRIACGGRTDTFLLDQAPCPAFLQAGQALKHNDKHPVSVICAMINIDHAVCSGTLALNALVLNRLLFMGVHCVLPACSIDGYPVNMGEDMADTLLEKFADSVHESLSFLRNMEERKNMRRVCRSKKATIPTTDYDIIEKVQRQAERGAYISGRKWLAFGKVATIKDLDWALKCIRPSLLPLMFNQPAIDEETRVDWIHKHAAEIRRTLGVSILNRVIHSALENMVNPTLNVLLKWEVISSENFEPNSPLGSLLNRNITRFVRMKMEQNALLTSQIRALANCGFS